MWANLRGRGAFLGAIDAQNFRSQTSGRLHVRAQSCDKRGAECNVFICGLQRRLVSTAPVPIRKRGASCTSNGAESQERCTGKTSCLPRTFICIGLLSTPGDLVNSRTRQRTVGASVLRLGPSRRGALARGSLADSAAPATGPSRPNWASLRTSGRRGFLHLAWTGRGNN